MRFGNASTTVTGTVTPASVNTRVMPHLRPTRPMDIVNPHTARASKSLASLRQISGLDTRTPDSLENMASAPTRSDLQNGRGSIGIPCSSRKGAYAAPHQKLLIQLDLHVHAGRKLELHEGVHGLVRGVQNIHEPLVRADFKLVTGVLIAVGGRQNRKTLHFDGQRHGTLDGRAGAFRGIDDLAGRLVDQAMIESLQADANILISHVYLGFLSACALTIPGAETGPVLKRGANTTLIKC